jgi:hypothetical protein
MRTLRDSDEYVRRLAEAKGQACETVHVALKLEAHERPEGSGEGYVMITRPEISGNHVATLVPG